MKLELKIDDKGSSISVSGEENALVESLVIFLTQNPEVYPIFKKTVSCLEEVKDSQDFKDAQAEMVKDRNENGLVDGWKFKISDN